MSIKKISEITGISAASVARALSGNGYCSKEKKEKIIAAAKAINYRPNLSAQTLRNNRSKKILLGIPDICNAFYFRMIESITNELDRYGYYPIIYNTRHSVAKEVELIDLLRQKYGDGLILVSFDFTETNISAVRKSGLPIVLTNKYDNIRDDDNFDYVYSDHVLGMELATSHLIESGCRDIVLVSGAKSEQTSLERICGYKNILKKNNIHINEEYILDGGFITQKAYEVFGEFVNKNLPYDGIITANELMCMGITRYFSEKSRSVRDVKFISFDNTDFSENLEITSVDLRQDEIGRLAVKMILERIFNDRHLSQKIYIEPKLIVRKSTL